MLHETNVDGTLSILDQLEDKQVGSFCYVGSAYSCGGMTGTIPADKAVLIGSL